VPAILATSHLFAPVAGARYGAIKQRIQSAIVDRYLAVSREVAQRLCSDLGIARSKVRVVHNGIQTAKFDVVPDIGLRRSLTDGRDRPIVLVPARLHSQKGHVYLLQAAALVPGVVFALAGDGPERSALESLAHQLHIEDRVRFLGQRCDMPQLYAACDLVVLPSLYEGLPLTPLEAMASAKPVIATAVGGTDEAVVNGVTGLLVPPKSIAPLAAAINELLTRRELAAALGNEGRRRVLSRFSIESMVQGVVANYDEFLGRAAVALRTH
jgi:glycosyltransferase involved in cell wall biosynthesis